MLIEKVIILKVYQPSKTDKPALNSLNTVLGSMALILTDLGFDLL